MIRTLFLAATALVLMSLSALAAEVTIKAGTYVGDFRDGNCGVLVIKEDGSGSYTSGPCQGGKLTSVAYTARKVKVKGSLITVDDAKYNVTTAVAGQLLGKWTLGGNTGTMHFK